MTVSSALDRKTFTGDDATTAFATTPVVFFDETDLQVYVIVIATGVATLQSLTTDYTVSGGAGSTGTVTMLTAPASTEQLLIKRVVPITQAVDLVNNDASDAETMEDSLDKLTMIAQQLSAGSVSGGYPLRISDAETPTDALTVLPFDRASKLLGFNSAKELVTYDPADGANDSASVTFLADGAGATARTAQAKLRDIISLDDFSTSGQYDTAAQATIGGGKKLALPTTQFYKQATGEAQIELIGTAARYAQIRCTGDGTDDGDLFFYQTGDNVWFQSKTDTYRQTMSLVPKGTVTVAPANLELNGTDTQADATNYERFRIHSMGTSEDAHEITSEKGGTGTVRPIHIFLGGIANGIFLNASGFNGVGTKTPRAKWDILDASAVQLRLTQADNSKYVDFQVDSSSNITVTPEGSGIARIASSLRIHHLTGTPAGGTAGSGFMFSSTANFGVFFGSGAPSLAAAQGSLYLRSDGGAGTRAYINTDGNTTWTAVTTAA